MAKQVLKILFIFIPILVFVRCAQVVPLTGGKKDVIPPKLLSAVPSQNSLHFDSDLIVLTFNEYMKVKDLNNQFTISPKLKTSPDVQSDGKTVRISLKKEELSLNTTYRLSFGKALVDVNEGNAVQNYEYVFSTGDFIDTLRAKGKVLEAFTNKPAGNILIALYSQPDSLLYKDSLPYLQTPDYISKTNENGAFRFSNLPYKTFKAFAIDDKSKNLLYDGETERIAFLSSDVSLVSDTSINFRLFQEEASKSFIKRTLTPYLGLVQILLNKKQKVGIEPLNPADSASIFEKRAGQRKDTVSIYYKNISDTLGLVLSLPKKSDTLKIALPKRPANKKKFKTYRFNTSVGLLSLNTPLVITFLNWMNIEQTQLPELRLFSKEDSLINLEPVKGKWLDINRFEITNTFREGVNYKVKVDTCAFLDVNDICNDSSSTNFKTESKVEFGKVTLKMLFNTKQPYIVQLVNDKDEVAKEAFISFSLSSSNAVSIDFSDIKPGIYLVKIIFDINGNHLWDTGNLLSNKQPEHVIVNSKQIKVLPDWEIEEEISTKE